MNYEMKENENETLVVMEDGEIMKDEL